VFLYGRKMAHPLFCIDQQIDKINKKNQAKFVNEMGKREIRKEKIHIKLTHQNKLQYNHRMALHFHLLFPGQTAI